MNEIPSADHGTILDPPTSDVSARCVSFLAEIGSRDDAFAAGLRFLRSEQERDGSWFGRWGTNYIYGTCSVLIALQNAGDGPELPRVRRAADWLKGCQRPDGGWGEDCDTYAHPERGGRGYASTAFQTAWAMLGLMAAGEGGSPEVHRGAEYLLRSQEASGFWNADWFTAPGIPRIIYLKYHGYSRYFPLLALARYRNVCRASHAPV